MLKLLEKKRLSKVALKLLESGVAPIINWQIYSLGDVVVNPEFGFYYSYPQIILSSDFHPVCQVDIGDETSFFDIGANFSASLTDMQITSIQIQPQYKAKWNVLADLNAEEQQVFDYLLEKYSDVMSVDKIQINDSIRSDIITYCEKQAPYGFQSKASKDAYMRMNHLMCFSGCSHNCSLDHHTWIDALKAMPDCIVEGGKEVLLANTIITHRIIYKKIEFTIQKDVAVSLGSDLAITVTQLPNDVIFSAKTSTGDVYEDLPAVVRDDFIKIHLGINDIPDIPELAMMGALNSFTLNLANHMDCAHNRLFSKLKDMVMIA